MERRTRSRCAPKPKAEAAVEEGGGEREAEDVVGDRAADGRVRGEAQPRGCGGHCAGCTDDVDCAPAVGGTQEARCPGRVRGGGGGGGGACSAHQAWEASPRSDNPLPRRHGPAGRRQRVGRDHAELPRKLGLPLRKCV